MSSTLPTLPSSTLPTLPQFLTQPLECPINRCRYPGRPLLTPESSFAILEVLPALFIRRLADEVWLIADLYLPTALADPLILELALQLPLDKFPLEMEDFSTMFDIDSQPDPIAKANNQSDQQLEERIGLLFHNTILTLWRNSMGIEHEGKERLTEGACLHDLVGAPFAGNMRQLYGRNKAEATMPPTRSKFEPDSKSLLASIKQGIASGSIDASWGEQRRWEKVVQVSQANCCEAIRTFMYQKVSAIQSKRGYEEASQRPGAVLAAFSHLLRYADNSATPAIKKLLLASPQLSQLTRFCHSPPAHRKLVLSTTPSIAPFELYRPKTYFSSQGLFAAIFSLNTLTDDDRTIGYPTTTSGTASSRPASDSTLATFDPLERIPNLHSDYSYIDRFVPPRFCSPNLWTGRDALVENYDSVDQVLRDCFVAVVEMESLKLVARKVDELYPLVIQNLLPRLGTLKVTTSNEKELLLSHMHEARMAV